MIKIEAYGGSDVGYSIHRGSFLYLLQTYSREYVGPSGDAWLRYKRYGVWL